MSEKERSAKALTRIERRPTGRNQPLVVSGDPITVGPDRTISVDATKLPTPPNLYDADVSWVEHRPGSVSLFFAKLNRDEPDKLRTRLELRYPAESLVRQFWRNTRGFHERIKEYAQKWPVDQARQALTPGSMASGRDHSEWANFESIAHAGTEASIDFYLMPASGVARFASGQGSSGLRFAPVVRVQLTIFELVRLLDATEPVVKQVREYLPKEHDEDAERRVLEEAK